MIFDYPWLFLFLALVALFFLLWRISVRRKEERMRRFAESGFAGKLLVGYAPKLRMWHFILFSAGTIFLIIALAGPLIVGGKQKVTNSGIDIVVVLDVSNSMRARDLQPSRIERAKLALMQAIPNMGNDRLGVVVFAGQGYPTLPLTDDHSAAEMILESVSPDMVSMQGTAIGSAIDQATSAFRNTDEDRGKAIIVISDGENHEDDAVDAARRARKKGIIVSAIGIGSAQGTTIPDFDENGKMIGNKKDEYGKEIVSKLDEATLQGIASEGNGVYVHATTGDLGFMRVYNSLQGLSKTTSDTWKYTSFTPIYQWFLVAALLLLITESLLPEGKRNEFVKR